MTSKDKSAAGQFFILQPDAGRGGAGHGVIFENRKELLTLPRRVLRPDAGGFPVLVQTPRLVASFKSAVERAGIIGGAQSIDLWFEDVVDF